MTVLEPSPVSLLALALQVPRQSHRREHPSFSYNLFVAFDDRAKLQKRDTEQPCRFAPAAGTAARTPLLHNCSLTTAHCSAVTNKAQQQRQKSTPLTKRYSMLAHSVLSDRKSVCFYMLRQTNPAWHPSNKVGGWGNLRVGGDDAVAALHCAAIRHGRSADVVRRALLLQPRPLGLPLLRPATPVVAGARSRVKGVG